MFCFCHVFPLLSYPCLVQASSLLFFCLLSFISRLFFPNPSSKPRDLSILPPALFLHFILSLLLFFYFSSFLSFPTLSYVSYSLPASHETFPCFLLLYSSISFFFYYFPSCLVFLFFSNSFPRILLPSFKPRDIFILPPTLFLHFILYYFPSSLVFLFFSKSFPRILHSH